jgi:diaminopimelate epimerase
VTSHGLHALKGHGTENDFVVLPDLDGVVSLSPSLVRALCDRHAGIGGDGVLRVVRTSRTTEPDVLAQASAAEYFMDYHNADGSIAEMCGNGVRVFARYLASAGLVDPASGPVGVATRGGTRTVWFDGPSGEISVDMGRSMLRAETPKVSAVGLMGEYPGTAIDMPNPHVVIDLDDPALVAALDLAQAPHVTPPLPEGQNVEFIARTGEHALVMRVHERGVGETRSCGTGICAAVVAAAGDAPSGVWTVDVPGGRCRVSWTDQGGVVLTGPAELVAEVTISERWLSAHR